jgi:hypothetical protein
VPIRHEVRDALLWIVVDGVYDDAELRAAWQRAFSDPAFRKGMPALIDSRKSLANPSRELLMERADFLAGLRAHIGPRLAFLVADALHYGLARMVAVFTEQSGLEIQVFEDARRAEAWLLEPRGVEP